MAKRVGGQSFETVGAAAHSAAIAVDSTTSSTLITALSDIDPIRFFVDVTNYANKGLWVKLQAASVDDDKKGIYIEPGEHKRIMRAPIEYHGEISAIRQSGPAMEVFVTWL